MGIWIFVLELPCTTSPRLCMSLSCFRMMGRAPSLLQRLPRCHKRGGLCSVCKQSQPPAYLGGKSASLSSLSWRSTMGGDQTMDCWQFSLLWKICLVSGTNKLKSKAIIPIGNNHTCAKHVYNLLSLSVSYWFNNAYCSALIFFNALQCFRKYKP